MASRRPWLDFPAWLGAIGACVAALALSAHLAPQIGVAPLAGFAIGFAFTVGETLWTARLAPRLSGGAWGVLVLPVAALVGVRVTGLSGLGAACSVTAALLAVGTGLGASIGARVQHPGHLLVVASVSALADLWSVLHPAGATAAVIQAPESLSVLALPWALPGVGAIEPLLGVGDVVFASLYLRAARVHGLDERRTTVALALGFAVVLALLIVLARALPALPFLGLAVLVSHPEARRLPPGERRLGWTLILGLAVLVALAFVLQSR